MNFTEKLTDLRANTRNRSGVVKWTVPVADGIFDIGTEVTPIRITKVYPGTTPTEANELLTAIRQGVVKAAPSTPEEAERLSEEFILPRFRIQTHGTTVLYLIRTGGALDILGTNIDLDTDVVQRILTSIASKEPVAHSAWVTATGDILRDSGVPSRGKGAITTNTVMLDVLNRLIAKADPRILMPDNAPLLAWDTDSEETIRHATQVLTTSLVVPGDYSVYQSFLSRMDFPEEFMAFCWKCFKTDDEGRQLAWTYGRGNAGLSGVWGALLKAMGQAGVLIPQMQHQDKHTTSTIFGHRFAVMAETSATNLLRSSMIKSITGRDFSQINKKFMAPFSARIYCRVAVYGNIYPVINTLDRAQVTRLLLFTVKSFEGESNATEFDVLLGQQVWHFLHACREMEAKLCGNTEKPIPVPEGMAKSIVNNCETQTRKWMYGFLNRCAKFDRAFNEGYTQEQIMSDFKRYVSNRKGVQKTDLLSLLRAGEDRAEFMDNLKTAMYLRGATYGSDDSGSGTYSSVRFYPEEWDHVTEEGAEEESEI